MGANYSEIWAKNAGFWARKSISLLCVISDGLDTDAVLWHPYRDQNYPTNPCATSNSPFRIAPPAAPRMVLCDRLTNLM